MHFRFLIFLTIFFFPLREGDHNLDWMPDEGMILEAIKKREYNVLMKILQENAFK